MIAAKNTDPELLPCPFCGGGTYFSFGRDDEVVNVRCENWGTSCLGAGPNKSSPKDAAKAWNTRLAAASSAGAVKVKPLDWQDEPNRPWNCPAWNAVSVTGQSFRVFKAWWGAKDKWGYVYGDFHHTEAEAKAAAQADYEQRILSAITPEPAKAGDAVLLREALETAFGDVLSRIFVFRDHLPEEDETWESWYYAAFDLLSAEVRNMRDRALSAAQGGKQSDGGAKAGSSPILANKEDQRTDTHGMMPVGDNAANIGCTGVGPSDTAPAEPVRSAFIDALDDKLRELDADWTLHGGPFDSKWVSDVLDAVRNESHPPRSVDIEAIKAAVLPIVLQGFRDRLSGNEVATQVARSIAAMIEGE